MKNILTIIITHYIIIVAYCMEEVHYIVSYKKKKASIDFHSATEFLRGQASKIFDEICKKDDIVIVLKNSKPKNVIISYERYERLKEKGIDIQN